MDNQPYTPERVDMLKRLYGVEPSKPMTSQEEWTALNTTTCQEYKDPIPISRTTSRVLQARHVDLQEKV
ncbi:MAG: hypothetical protein AABX66_03965 [Nanoarchaeota archaeon]